MAMQIDLVKAEMDVLPDAPAPTGGTSAAGSLPAAELRALLRPLVLEILGEELDRLTRRYGR
ncbi:MAG: hypothetical protein WKG32_20510 [Gemmatimonadaceae bacterium]